MDITSIEAISKPNMADVRTYKAGGKLLRRKYLVGPPDRLENLGPLYNL